MLHSRGDRSSAGDVASPGRASARARGLHRVRLGPPGNGGPIRDVSAGIAVAAGGVPSRQAGDRRAQEGAESGARRGLSAAPTPVPWSALDGQGTRRRRSPGSRSTGRRSWPGRLGSRTWRSRPGPVSGDGARRLRPPALLRLEGTLEPDRHRSVPLGSRRDPDDPTLAAESEDVGGEDGREGADPLEGEGDPASGEEARVPGKEQEAARADVRGPRLLGRSAEEGHLDRQREVQSRARTPFAGGGHGSAHGANTRNPRTM